MRRFFPITIFVIGMSAAVAILVLWIVRNVQSPVSLVWLLNGIFLMLVVILGMVLIFVFWTKSKMLETERANFIAGVSHELLTPLASLRLYTETMAIREVPEDKRREFLALMLEDTERLSNLISRILNASRLERGSLLLNFEVCNLAELIKVFIDSNVLLLRDVDLDLDLERDCLCKVDEDSFNMMLKNLLENAVRYSAAPARVSISLRKKDGKFLLQVTDHGIGLQPGQEKKIFRLFYQVSRKRGGAGLGLFIVRMVVRAHKGKVWAYSQGLGKGTTMNVELPAAAAGVDTGE